MKNVSLHRSSAMPAFIIQFIHLWKLYVYARPICVHCMHCIEYVVRSKKNKKKKKIAAATNRILSKNVI